MPRDSNVGPRGWQAAAEPIDSHKKWDPFIGSLKAAFVDDVEGKLNDLRGAGLGPLADALNDVRLRRNFSEHPEMDNKRTLDVERSRHWTDIGAEEPRTAGDWTRMQVGALARLILAFEFQVAALVPDET